MLRGTGLHWRNGFSLPVNLLLRGSRLTVIGSNSSEPALSSPWKILQRGRRTQPSGIAGLARAAFSERPALDMKALLSELVTTAAYRQRATSTPALTEKDRAIVGCTRSAATPYGRNGAGSGSGRKRTVVPHDGWTAGDAAATRRVWNSAYNYDQWIDATGPNRYRRAIYTFVKRTSGYPSFLTFDASDRDVSLSRRIPTNTPLQALIVLNDPVYQEAAEAMARLVAKEADAKVGSDANHPLDARLIYEAQLVLSRDPTRVNWPTPRFFR